jgi:hypothetical protein
MNNAPINVDMQLSLLYDDFISFGNKVADVIMILSMQDY